MSKHEITRKYSLLDFVECCIDENVGFNIEWELRKLNRKIIVNSVKIRPDKLRETKEFIENEMDCSLTYKDTNTFKAVIVGWEMFDKEEW